MKLVLLMFTLTGCATHEYTTLTRQIGDYGLESYDDKKNGVECYVYSDKDNIALSCVKVKN